jgi:hypothetical protein
MYMCFSGIDYPSAFMVSDKILELFWQGDIFSNLLSHGINLFLLNRNTIFASTLAVILFLVNKVEPTLLTYPYVVSEEWLFRRYRLQ